MYRPKHAPGGRLAPFLLVLVVLALLGAGGLAARLGAHGGSARGREAPAPASGGVRAATSNRPRPSAPPASSPSPVAARSPEPLPACGYDDVPVELGSYDDWARTVLDGRFALPAGYEPPDLVSVRLAGFEHDLRVRSLVVPDLEALGKAASAAGHPLSMVSAYRGFAQQQGLFDKRVAELGRDAALLRTARPGHSEHQLGTTIDFVTSGSSKVSRDWLAEPTGRWMSDNAWRFGFVMSYPRGMEALSCYTYEPWHYRYVGRDLAARIHRSGLVPRAYLWQKEHGAATPGS